MNPRWAPTAALCREVAIPALVLAWLVTSGWAGIDNTRAAPIVDRLATAGTKFADESQAVVADKPQTMTSADADGATVSGSATDSTADTTPPPHEREMIVTAGLTDSAEKPQPEAPRKQVAADGATAAGLVTEPAADTTLASHEQEQLVTAAADPSGKLPPETPPKPVGADAASATGSVAEPAANTTPALPKRQPIVTATLTDSSETLPLEQAAANAASEAPGNARQAVDSIEVLDECYVVDTCIDRYLWALYQRTPKEDTIKEEYQRKVTVKKKGKLVTVTRTFTTVVDEDFSWKDPKAAENAGMSMMDYVIGGMDPSFKLRLFHVLHAAEEIGLSPGITSAFRDDYRQSIASGLKAANDRSYHGGSFRGGYGHGLAADVVSVDGATRAQRLTATETLWKWIDAHGEVFGVGRPYLDRDPPHLAPIDGKEYADHHPKARQAASAAKARKGVAVRDEHGAAKRARTARS